MCSAIAAAAQHARTVAPSAAAALLPALLKLGPPPLLPLTQAAALLCSPTPSCCAAQCFPGDGYANINAVAPLMGNHYVKMDAPEMVAFATEGNGVPAWVSGALQLG